MTGKFMLAAGTAAVLAASGSVAAEVPDAPVSEAPAASRCAGLGGKQFAGASIQTTEYVPAGSALPPLPQKNSPAFCRVRAQIASAQGSEIKIEIWLPDNWNGKFAGIGGGGFEGGYAMANITLRKPVSSGYAGVVTNAGHDPQPEPKWALGQPEKIADFGHRANHLGAVVGKAVVADYYGVPAKRAVFHGCSNGGRDALILAQRYPEDYDAIAVGAPANDYSGLMASFAYIGQVARAVPADRAFSAKLKLVHDAAVAQCDKLDGGKDGLIGNPRICRFDPAVLACKGNASGENCLTKAEVGAVKKIYAGSRLRSGATVMPGLPVGSETDWTVWLTGPKALGPAMATSFYRYFVHGDPNWSPEAFDLDRDWKAGRATVSPVIDALNPDLRPFLSRGGKLLMYHGWDDAAIPAGNTLRYHAAMLRAVGPRLAAGTRLFMLPGVGHCAGGNGPDNIDYIAEADRWLESGTAPEQLIATKYDNLLAVLAGEEAKALKTRAACAWPKTAHYRGTGSTDEAASYTCR